MSEFRWEDPPPALRGPRYDWADIGQRLTAEPGRWAMVATYANGATAASAAANVCGGTCEPLSRLGQFEAVSRRVDNENRVYARFIGAES